MIHTLRLGKGFQLAFEDNFPSKRFLQIQTIAISNPTDKAIDFELYLSSQKLTSSEEARESGATLVPKTTLGPYDAYYLTLPLQLSEKDKVYISTSDEGLNFIVNFVTKITM